MLTSKIVTECNSFGYLFSCSNQRSPFASPRRWVKLWNGNIVPTFQNKMYSGTTGVAPCNSSMHLSAAAGADGKVIDWKYRDWKNEASRRDDVNYVECSCIASCTCCMLSTTLSCSVYIWRSNNATQTHGVALDNCFLIAYLWRRLSFVLKCIRVYRLRIQDIRTIIISPPARQRA